MRVLEKLQQTYLHETIIENTTRITIRYWTDCLNTKTRSGSQTFSGFLRTFFNHKALGHTSVFLIRGDWITRFLILWECIFLTSSQVSIDTSVWYTTWMAALATLGNLLQMHNLGPTLDLVNHNLHFRKIPMWSMHVNVWKALSKVSFSQFGS